MSADSEQLSTFLAVIGAGPGGYPAAFHAADLGMDVVLVERDPNPGGVCLYRGCIPSKAILHAAGIIAAAREADAIGISFGEPRVDLGRLREWKQSVVDKLTGGLGSLTRQRGITYVQGDARFIDSRTIGISTPGGERRTVRFEHAVLAAGSTPARPSMVPDSPRIMDSTGALVLDDVPGSLLVMGGGYIGLELGQAYAALGVRVTVIEMMSGLLPGLDRDLVKPLQKRITDQFEEVLPGSRVVGMSDNGRHVEVSYETPEGDTHKKNFDKVLVAVGRRPVTDGLGLENTKVELTDEGFVKVDEQRRTTDAAIMAVGDIAGEPMLAHKATHEGRSTVEALHDGKTVYAPLAIPAVVFTDPEIAWCGLTEDEATRQGLNVRTGTFPWLASGRAATLDRTEGLTKIVADADSGRVLGVGVSGHGAGELIGEGVLAIEMGAVAEDLALTIHAHPSLSETLMEAAEQVMGQSTHYFQRM